MTSGILFGIPCYKGGSLLDRALFSISVATEGDLPGKIHAIVYDDGSPKPEQTDIYETVKTWQKKAPIEISYAHLPEHRGLGYAYNSLAQFGNEGDIICLLDNDVMIPKNFPNILYNIFVYRFPQIGVASFVSARVSEEAHAGMTAGELGLARGHEKIEPATQLAGYAYAFRKSDWEAVGWFDTSYKAFLADSDFCCTLSIKLGKMSYRFHYPLVFHLEHATLYKHKELGWEKQLKLDREHFLEKWKTEPEKLEKRILAEWLNQREGRVISGTKPENLV